MNYSDNLQRVFVLCFSPTQSTIYLVASQIIYDFHPFRPLGVDVIVFSYSSSSPSSSSSQFVPSGRGLLRAGNNNNENTDTSRSKMLNKNTHQGNKQKTSTNRQRQEGPAIHTESNNKMIMKDKHTTRQ